MNMKKTGVLASLACAVACGVAQGAGLLGVERPYDFRKRLEEVHEPNRFDAGAKPAADEFAFRDGVVLRLKASADRELVFRAAQDFQDYLAVSMGVSARIARSGEKDVRAIAGKVEIEIDAKLPARSYEVEADGDGIEIDAADERAAAQALYFLEDAMNLRRAPFFKFGKQRRRQLFSPRMTHSGWGVDVFPDAHLNQIAHAGMDAILIFVKDIDKTKGADYQDVNEVIRRAKKFGLDTYLYSYIVAFAHPADKGGREMLEASYGRVAGYYPDAKGIVFVGESCQFPTKDERAQPVTWRNKIPGDTRPTAGWWPCRDYPEWLRAVKGAIDAKSPGMEIVFWTYNWGKQPKQPRLELIDSLPKDVTLMATFEMFEEQTKKNGLKGPSADYSLSFAGPGQYFSSEAEEAHKMGLRLYSMSNTGGLTWDFGTIPYQPCPYQWENRYKGILKAQKDWGLSGLMECHHYGWWPSFISEVEKNALTEGGMPFEEHLRALAARDFGAGNADAALAAWKGFSDVMRDYVASDENQYGPFRIGPSYPYNFGGAHIETKEFPCPKHASFGIRICRLNYNDFDAYDTSRERPLDVEKTLAEMPLLEGMAAAYDSGAATFERIAASLPAARAEKAARMANLARYLYRTTMTAINVKRGAVAHNRGDKAEVLKWAKAEYANALAAIPVVEADSRLGWEPSMEYVGGPEQIRWKLDRMEKLYGREVCTQR